MTLIDKSDLLTGKDGRVTTHFNEVIKRISLFYMQTNHLSRENRELNLPEGEVRALGSVAEILGNAEISVKRPDWNR